MKGKRRKKGRKDTRKYGESQDVVEKRNSLKFLLRLQLQTIHCVMYYAQCST